MAGAWLDEAGVVSGTGRGLLADGGWGLAPASSANGFGVRRDLPSKNAPCSMANA